MQYRRQHHRIKSLHRTTILCALLLLFGCTNEEPIREIKVGLLVDSSTPGGKPTINASKMFINQFNKLKQRKFSIELIIEDTGSQSDTALAAARRLIFKHKVKAIIGPNTSRSAYKASAVSEAAKILMISPGATSEKVDNNKQYVFRMACNNQAQGKLLAEFAYKELRLEKSAVLYNISNPASRTVAETFDSEFKSLGGKTIIMEHYIDGKTDIKALIRKIADSNVELVVLPNATKTSKSQITLLKDAQFKGKIFGSDNWSPLIVTQLDIFDGVYYIRHWHPQLTETNQTADNFYRNYKEKYQQTPTSMSALTFDSFQLLTKALNKHLANKIPLVDAITLAKPFQGVTGQVNLTAGYSKKTPYIVQVLASTDQLYRSNAWSNQ